MGSSSSLPTAKTASYYCWINLSRYAPLLGHIFSSFSNIRSCRQQSTVATTASSWSQHVALRCLPESAQAAHSRSVQSNCVSETSGTVLCLPPVTPGL